MAFRQEATNNRLSMIGSLRLEELWRVSATIHKLVRKQGYQDLVLDFSRCTAAMPSPMLGLCAEVSGLRHDGIEVSITLPSDDKLARLFVNANWAHILDPASFKKTTYKGFTNLPVSRFQHHDEQPVVVDRLVDSVLCSLQGVERGDLAAIEWAINEITDNVLVHSQSPVGGFIQLTNYRQTKRVEFSVADAGIGIPETLKPRFEELSDAERLERATKEGVTRDPAIGQGNGLYGTFQVSRANGGMFQILSGYGLLKYEKEELKLTNERAPFPGTLVVASIDCSNPSALADALRFGERQYRPLDFIETRYEDRASDDLVFRMQEEAGSFGSRVAGTPIRNRLLALRRMHPERRLRVDMSGVHLVSSSFADEVFGKLFKQLGPLNFSSAIDMTDVNETVRLLIDKAISQRMRSDF